MSLPTRFTEMLLRNCRSRESKPSTSPEGGSQNFNFATRRSESELHTALRLVRGVRRPKTGYFLRAESYFNVATEIERLDREGGMGPPIIASYGGRSLHEQSHGESFIALVKNRFSANGFYVLDEPEAALSPQKQLSFLVAMHELVRAATRNSSSPRTLPSSSLTRTRQSTCSGPRV